jgi:hypothetical protein
MVPDADLQLAVAIKALTEVVAPAIDPADRLAIEQLHLSIATIGLVRNGLALQHRRARRELANAIDLAEAVATAGAPAPASLNEAHGALEDATRDEAALDAVRRELLEQIEASVASTAGMPAEQNVARAVVAGSRAQFDLARAWCQPAGFEVKPGLPSLELLLAE